MTLVVYADTLLLVSFLYSMSGLVLFGLIYNYKIRAPMIIIASVVGGAISSLMVIMTIKLKIPLLFLLVAIFLTMALSLRISYEFETFRMFFKGIVALFVIGLTESGISVLIISIVAYKVSFWFPLYVIILIIIYGLAIILLYRNSKWIELHKYSVRLKLLQNREEIRGMVDTGNVLTDPLHGRPVIILSSEYREEVSVLWCESFEMSCYTVNGESRLKGGVVRVLMISNGNREKIYYNVPVAIGNFDFLSEGFGAIVPVDYVGGL